MEGLEEKIGGKDGQWRGVEMRRAPRGVETKCLERSEKSVVFFLPLSPPLLHSFPLFFPITLFHHFHSPSSFLLFSFWNSVFPSFSGSFLGDFLSLFLLSFRITFSFFFFPLSPLSVFSSFPSPSLSPFPLFYLYFILLSPSTSHFNPFPPLYSLSFPYHLY